MPQTPSRCALPKNAPCDIPEPLEIWPEGTPGFEPDRDNQDKIAERGEDAFNRFFSNISIPGLYAFPAKPDNNNGKAVIICPGGGYTGVAIDKEGFDVARFLNSNGISAFVLKYRCPAPDGRHGHLMSGPLDDACRSIRIVRSRAAEYGIDTHKIGIMGFSSGGHVAATASTLYNDIQDINPFLDKISARPDFSILLYPVITLFEDFCHMGSRHNLLGLHPDDALMKKFSPEFNITEDTPRAFLAQTLDDSVHVFNSINYCKAAAAAKVPVEMHIFSEGGHGYGMFIRGLAVDSWPDRLIEWLSRF